MSRHRPIELTAPDLSAWKNSNTGVDYVWHFDSGQPGPRVMVQALTHGNEICGAIALDGLLRSGFRPAIGQLTLAFGNIEAFARWDPADPDRSRYVDEDYNRVWADETLLGGRDSIELRRARELRPFVDASDFLLDIHSMHEPCRPIMVCGATGKGGDKSAAFSRRMGVPEHLLIDTGHPAGLRMIERGGFGEANNPRTAVLIECGQHWERAAAEVAHDTMVRFLALLGSMPAGRAQAQMRRPAADRQRVIRVTEPVVARSLAFRFHADYVGLEVIARKGDLIATDGAHEIRAPYDETVLVMPSMAHLKVGTTMVRLGRFED